MNERIEMLELRVKQQEEVIREMQTQIGYMTAALKRNIDNVNTLRRIKSDRG